MKIVEEWRTVEKYPNYEVSSTGRVRNILKGNELKPYDNHKGYLYVKLGKNEKQERVSRLVAQTFIPNPENKPIVNHIDGDTHNNNIENLEWCTYSENNRNPVTMERLKKSRKRFDNHNPKPILQFDVDGKLLGYWCKSLDIRKTIGCDKSDLSKCCRGLIKTVRGYKWMYMDDYLADWWEEEYLS